MSNRSAHWRVRLGSIILICVLALSVFQARLPGQEELQEPAVSSSGGDGVVASVGKRDISMHEVEEHWRGQDPAGFMRVRQLLLEAERRALDEIIGQYLLEEEAAKRNTTVEQVLAVVRQSAPEPSEAEIREIYDRSSALPQGVAFKSAAPMIASYLREQKSAEARRLHIDELRRTAAVDIKLDLDARLAVRGGPDDPSIGPDSAPVEIVEFSDFECPYCRQAAPVLKQVAAEHRGQVRLVWKDFPLPAHPSAESAAEAAHCAQAQGKFWEYHDVLFRNQHALAPQNLGKLAAEVDLNVNEFNECVGSGRYRTKVAAGLDEGKSAGVSATPTVFINGRLVMGAVPIDMYRRIVREELTARAGRESGRIR